MVKKGAMPKVDKKPEPKPTSKFGECGPGTELVDGICQVKKSWFQRNYMLTTTIVAALTAIGNLFIIFWMSGHNPFAEMIINYVAKLFALDPGLKLTALDPGLGLGAIGIMTFFGVSLSSSIFEEHRHKHGNEQNGNLISNVIVGKGIMRKGLAASLVMTYIVLIGLSFSAGNLYTSFSDVDDTNNNINGTNNDANNFSGTVLNNSTIIINSYNVDPNIEIKDIVTLGAKVKSIEDSILAKESNSLVQHFTIVISLVIGFYFSANFLTAYINARKEDKTSNDLSKINLESLPKRTLEDLGNKIKAALKK